MVPQPTIIVRQGPPNIYDHAPYGSICKVSGNSTIWKQISKDDSHPLWDDVTDSYPLED